MGKNFNIAYDSAAKKWLPTEIRVRMLSQAEEGSYEPCEFTDPEFSCEPAGWLSFSPQAEGEIVCARVEVTEEFLQLPGEDKFLEPVQVRVEAKPENADSEQQPITTDCQVSIEEPGVNMDFTVSPDECYKEGEVWLSADAESVCNLIVWVEVVDPETGEVFRAPDEDYEFKFETGFDPETLLCLDEEKGIIPPESRWRTAKSMLDLDEPLRDTVTVKAYSTKKQSDRPAGKLEIPWALFASEIVYEKEFNPELPVLPGQEVSIELKLNQQGLDAPLADTDIQFVWADSCKESPLGTLGSESARTDSEGMVTLNYIPPEELLYKSGGRYFDEIFILAGGGENPVQLKESVVLPVAPQIQLVPSLAEKKGLLLDPEQEMVEILPEQVTGGKITGNLVLPIQMEGGPLKRFGVAYAELEVALGEEAEKVKIQTRKNGLYRLNLKEINQAFARAELETKPIRLSKEPEDNMLFKMILAEEEESLIEQYEDDLTENRLSVFSEKFKRSLNFYRYHFCSQLARKKVEKYELAVAGMQLLRVAVRGTNIYLGRFKGHEDMVKSRVENLVKTIISIGFSALSASTKLREWGGSFARGVGNKAKKLVEWLVNSRFGRWIAKGASWLGDFATNVGNKAMKQIRPMVQSMRQAILGLVSKLGQAGQKFSNYIGSLLDEMVTLIDDLSIALMNKVEAFNQMLSNSSEHWDELVEWVSKKKGDLTQAAGDFSDKASGWVKSFVDSFKQVAKSVLELVGTMFEKLGNLLCQGLTMALSWCGKMAIKLLQPIYDWVLEHSDAAKEVVEEIINSDPSREAAENAGIEAVIGALFNEVVTAFFNWKPVQGSEDALMQQVGMKFSMMGRQPNRVVGDVYRRAVNQHLPKDWEGERSEFIESVVEASSKYHGYELTTNRIDEVADIINIIVAVGGLGIALLGVVFSGGTGIAAAAAAVAKIELAFNIAKGAMCDIPQIALAVILMFALIIKYDLLVVDLCFGNSSSGGSA
ncbi:MAG: hypothetical protein ACQETH_10230 [Candidatus Rifleibacteriota bacterium]